MHKLNRTITALNGNNINSINSSSSITAALTSSTTSGAGVGGNGPLHNNINNIGNTAAHYLHVHTMKVLAVPVQIVEVQVEDEGLGRNFKLSMQRCAELGFVDINVLRFCSH